MVEKYLVYNAVYAETGYFEQVLGIFNSLPEADDLSLFKREFQRRDSYIMIRKIYCG